LLVVSALAVAGAVLSGSWIFVTTAAVLGVVLGASATRITHSELLQTRRADDAEAEGSRLAVALEDSEERAAEAIVRVAELEGENSTLRSENDVLKSELDIATSWPAAGTA
jgi:hypothetical protein